MESATSIPEEISNKIPEILDLWRGNRLEDPDDEASLRLAGGIERLVAIFVDFLQSPESVDTFTRGGEIRSLVRDISASQLELDRDAVGVIEDFTVLRRCVWRTVEENVDVHILDGPEVARFFTKMLQASDWVTEAGLEAFETAVREQMQQAVGEAEATDLLTGLPDRERFNRLLLPKAIDEYERFALAVFDIADFSDTVAEGDIDRARSALKNLSDAVVSSVPDGTICARFGDDEICALLTGMGGEDAYHMSEAVLGRLAEENLGFKVDVGVAEYPAHGSDAGELVRETLRAMSMAKRVGGSGIVIAR